MKYFDEIESNFQKMRKPDRRFDEYSDKPQSQKKKSKKDKRKFQQQREAKRGEFIEYEG